MPDGPSLVLEAHPSIAKIEKLWRSLEGADASPGLSFEWLSALERTGCASAKRGWAPHHLVLRNATDELVGAAPCYVKGNSEGEFVFDFSWANAASRFGVEYYPKLLVAVPFTPASGSRVLVPKGGDVELAATGLAAGLAHALDALDLSSAHVLFPTKDEADRLTARGMIPRFGLQYHFHNPGYASFEDFLASLPQKRRTQIRRERKSLVAAGIRIETVVGSDAKPPLVDAMFDFYVSTVEKFHWGRQYLNRAFFEEVFATMGDALEIVVARNASGNRSLAPSTSAARTRSTVAIGERRKRCRSSTSTSATTTRSTPRSPVEFASSSQVQGVSTRPRAGSFRR